MGRLLHLVQRGGDWAGSQPAQALPLCVKCNSPSINRQCTNFVLLDVAIRLPLHSKWLKNLCQNAGIGVRFLRQRPSSRYTYCQCSLMEAFSTCCISTFACTIIGVSFCLTIMQEELNVNKKIYVLDPSWSRLMPPPGLQI